MPWVAALAVLTLSSWSDLALCLRSAKKLGASVWPLEPGARPSPGPPVVGLPDRTPMNPMTLLRKAPFLLKLPALVPIEPVLSCDAAPDRPPIGLGLGGEDTVPPPSTFPLMSLGVDSERVCSEATPSERNRPLTLLVSPKTLSGAAFSSAPSSSLSSAKLASSPAPPAPIRPARLARNRPASYRCARNLVATGDASSVASSDAAGEAARPRLDLEMERARGAGRLGVLLRLLVAEGVHFVGESLLREMDCDRSEGEAEPDVLSNILMRSLALVGDEGMESFSGLEGLELVKRCSNSLVAAATEVADTVSPLVVGLDGESDVAAAAPVRGSADEAALVMMPLSAARELETEPTWESGRAPAIHDVDTGASASVAFSVVAGAGSSAMASFCRLFSEVRKASAPEKMLVASVKSVWFLRSLGMMLLGRRVSERRSSSSSTSLGVTTGSSAYMPLADWDWCDWVWCLLGASELADQGVGEVTS